jgi:predicted GH43/DUF377 family glycosyl hydrolase
VKLQRYEKNPIIAPNPKNDWENLVTTNPGAWYDNQAGQVKLLYRAAGDDHEHKVYFGLATSENGYDFKRTSDEPVFGPSQDGFDAGCVEDPRIVKMGQYYYITYATRMFPPGQYWKEGGPYQPPECPDEFPLVIRENATLTGLAITKDFKTYLRAGRMTCPLVDDRDVILFPEKINGKYAMLHRPMTWVGEQYGTEHPAMWISFSDDSNTDCQPCSGRRQTPAPHLPAPGRNNESLRRICPVRPPRLQRSSVRLRGSAGGEVLDWRVVRRD